MLENRDFCIFTTCNHFMLFKCVWGRLNFNTFWMKSRRFYLVDFAETFWNWVQIDADLGKSALFTEIRFRVGDISEPLNNREGFCCQQEFSVSAWRWKVGCKFHSCSHTALRKYFPKNIVPSWKALYIFACPFGDRNIIGFNETQYEGHIFLSLTST
jgi:hypothetical protein